MSDERSITGLRMERCFLDGYGLQRPLIWIDAEGVAHVQDAYITTNGTFTLRHWLVRKLDRVRCLRSFAARLSPPGDPDACLIVMDYEAQS